MDRDGYGRCYIYPVRVPNWHGYAVAYRVDCGHGYEHRYVECHFDGQRHLDRVCDGYSHSYAVLDRHAQPNPN